MLPDPPVPIGSDEWHKNLSRFMMSVDTLISEKGWVVQGVEVPDGTSPSFAYTIGLNVQHFPELVIVGLPIETAQTILNEIAHEMFKTGEVVDSWNLANEYVATLVHQRSCDTRDLRLGVAHQFYRGHVPVSQVVWPDEGGAYPWDSSWKHPGYQPVLDPRLRVA